MTEKRYYTIKDCMEILHASENEVRYNIRKLCLVTDGRRGKKIRLTRYKFDKLARELG